MFCLDCFATVYLIVDGKEMTEDELLHLRVPPKSIERRLTHKRWCPNQDNLGNMKPDYSKAFWSKGQ